LPEGDETVCLSVVEKGFMLFNDEIFWDLKEEGREGRSGLTKSDQKPNTKT
jgi:hypothetical protein